MATSYFTGEPILFVYRININRAQEDTRLTACQSQQSYHIKDEERSHRGHRLTELTDLATPTVRTGHEQS
jgi:hypothetical protein